MNPLLLALLVSAACAPEKPADERGIGRDDTNVDTSDTTVDSGDTTVDTAETADTGAATDDTAAETGDTGACPSLCASGACTLDVDTRTATVSGSLRLDGADLDPDEHWSLVFAGDGATWEWWEDAASFHAGSVWGAGALADIASMDVEGGAWTGRVPLGTWDVFLSRGDTERVPVATGVVVAADGTLDVEATRYAVELSVTVGGEPIPQPASGTSAWTLVLTDDATRARREVSAFSDATMTVRLPAGTWTASLEMLRDDLGVATGTWDLGTFTVTGDTAVALDADAVTVGGALAWGGVAPWDEFEDDPIETWGVELTDVSGAGSWSIGFEDGDTWSTRVPPSAYDVYLAGPSTALAASAVALTTDTTLDLSVDLYTWTGHATYDGAPIRGTSWRVWFIDPVTGERLAADTHDGGWSIELPGGVYDVYVTDASGYLADGAAHVASGVVVAADDTLDVAIQDYAVSGTIAFGGGAPPNPSGSSDWGLVFVDTSTGEELSALYASATTWSTRLPAGTWDVWMWWQDDTVWDTPYARLADDVVITGDTTLDLRLETASLYITLALDGVPVADDPDRADAFLYWLDLSTGAYNSRTLGDGGATTLVLPSGAYAFWEQTLVLDDAGTTHVAALGSCLEVE